MTSPTNPNRPDLNPQRRMREAMGPGYQVAIFHERAALISPRRRTWRY